MAGKAVSDNLTAIYHDAFLQYLNGVQEY